MFPVDCLCRADLEQASLVVEDLMEVVGTEEDEGAEVSARMPTVNIKTHRVVTAALLAHVDAALDDVEWVLAALRGAARPGGVADIPLAKRADSEGAEIFSADMLHRNLSEHCNDSRAQTLTFPPT